MRFWKKTHHVSPETLSEYLDRRLTAVEHGEVERHLAACPGCQEELESLTYAVGILRQTPELRPRRVFTIARAPEPAPQPTGFRVPAFAYGAAASVAVILFAVLLSADLGGILSEEALPSTQDTRSSGITEPVAPAEAASSGTEAIGGIEAESLEEARSDLPTGAIPTPGPVAGGEEVGVEAAASAPPEEAAIAAAPPPASEPEEAMAAPRAEAAEAKELEAAPEIEGSAISEDAFSAEETRVEAESETQRSTAITPIEEGDGKAQESIATAAEDMDRTSPIEGETPEEAGSLEETAQETSITEPTGAPDGAVSPPADSPVATEGLPAPESVDGGTAAFWHVLEGILGAMALGLISAIVWKVLQRRRIPAE